ncbi:MJ0042 family finger-like domain-containing protein [Palleronia marisminoris]|uniref:Zinc finger/thioredoxin putative domain-containing protein n=1 Tax=Palleronia marisminoris TaxID=315423 RepID=A0A1Y5T0N8_9RHOB|nr:zinc-ribbon domain-containing protein [Palleronia marisminoris]SFH12984.1 MJ0042 family finger-like domain-containing protein [Palleronia marisminoris]SLN53213.1 hypothetical protein PAM7066_02495 [Palleronia marisminoris]
MRITCPNCAAQYEVGAGLISEDGRDVQCSACGHTWKQFGDGRVEEIPDEDTSDAAADEPEPEYEADDADAEEQPEGEVTVTRVPRRELDPDARRILREEAQREAARRRTRHVTAIEMQPDPALEVAPPAEEPAAPAYSAQRRRSGGGGMFPDIEEINSTLSAGTEADRDLTEPASASGAFRSGFLLMLALAILIMALYLAAPWLAAQVPALEPALAGYVGGVNSFRMAVEGLLQGAAEWIDGLSA